jgi:hypothetical protein
MNRPVHLVIMSWTAGSLLLATATHACAGGSADNDEDSLRYFGFVKDTNGKVLPEAQVSAGIKDSVTLSAMTDSTGAYRIPVPLILPGVSPQNITISCNKAGYKQMRATIRSSLNTKPLRAVEVECILQSDSVK